MKRQDLLIMLKLASLEILEREIAKKAEETNMVWGNPAPGTGWQGWEDLNIFQEEISPVEMYSVRNLSGLLGVSKSEISASIRRCTEINLIHKDPASGHLRPNKKALVGIIEHAVPYFFHATPGALSRGIPTAYAAPVLQKELKGSDDLPPVWPDPRGTTRGQSIEPIYKSVPIAVRKDKRLYGYLALVDAIRIGSPREKGNAVEILKGMLN